MRRIHIVGSKNHGKTTLLVELIDVATRRGLRVGAIKHSHHAHEVDRPGSDSFRLRGAGATPAAFVAESWMGIFVPCDSDPCYQQLEGLYAGCDLVLVEGDVTAGGTTVEVWRAALGTPPIALVRGGITAVVTDDPIDLDVPVFPRTNPDRLLDHLLALAGIAVACISGTDDRMTTVIGRSGRRRVPSTKPQCARGDLRRLKRPTAFRNLTIFRASAEPVSSTAPGDRAASYGKLRGERT